MIRRDFLKSAIGIFLPVAIPFKVIENVLRVRRPEDRFTIVFLPKIDWTGVVPWNYSTPIQLENYIPMRVVRAKCWTGEDGRMRIEEIDPCST